MFVNNSLTAPVEEINFTPVKRKESAPRVSPQKDDCSPLACTKGGPDYLVAYQGFLQELAKICPEACIFKSLPKLDPEETDTAESDANTSKLLVFLFQGTDQTHETLHSESHSFCSGCLTVLRKVFRINKNFGNLLQVKKKVTKHLQ